MTTERSPLDFYETNTEDISLILPKLWTPRRFRYRRFLVIDLGCGRGAIGAAIAAMFPNAIVFGIELDPERAREARTRTVSHDGITRPAYAHVWGGDALRPTLRRALRRRFHLAIGNPPFSFWGSFGVLAEDVILEDGEIALLGPATVIEGNPSAHPKFPQQPLRWDLFSRKGWGRYDCRKRPGFGRYSAGEFVKSGTDRMPYAWFCKGGEHAGRWDTLDRPTRKARTRKKKHSRKNDRSRKGSSVKKDTLNKRNMVSKTVRYSAHSERRAKEYSANLDALDFGRRVLSCIRTDCGRTAAFRKRIKAELDGWRPEHAPAGAPNARNWICPDCVAIDDAREREAKKERAGILEFLRAKCAELTGKDRELLETAIMRITVGRHEELDPLEHRAAGAYIKLRATLSNRDESSNVFRIADSVSSGSYRMPTPIQIELYPEQVLESEK